MRGKNSYRKKFRCWCKYRTSKPNCKSLDGMADYINFYWLWLEVQKRERAPKRKKIAQPSWIAAHILYITKIEIKNMLNTLTFISPPSRASDARTLASTIFFKSRCNLLWKSLNMVEPPDSTIFWDLPHTKKEKKTSQWVVK